MFVVPDLRWFVLLECQAGGSIVGPICLLDHRLVTVNYSLPIFSYRKNYFNLVFDFGEKCFIWRKGLIYDYSGWTIKTIFSTLVLIIQVQKEKASFNNKCIVLAQQNGRIFFFSFSFFSCTQFKHFLVQVNRLFYVIRFANFEIINQVLFFTCRFNIVGQVQFKKRKKKKKKQTNNFDALKISKISRNMIYFAVGSYDERRLLVGTVNSGDNSAQHRRT